MKKVLFTGPSGISCGLGNKLGIISNTDSIVNAFIDLDYIVEKRSVVPGENLDSFDKVFVTQQTIASFTAPFALGMAYAIGQRPDAIIVYDDWQAPQAFKLNDFDKTLECLWKPSLNRKYREEAEKVKDVIERGINTLTSANTHKYLIPLFMTDIFVKKALFDIPCFGVPMPYNPAYYMRDKYNYKDSHGLTYQKKKRHVLAALQDNSSWLNKHHITWPIHLLGVKKLNQDRVHEAELAKMYASSWGVLSPVHKKLCGTGWFRVRNLMAAEARSILIGDESDIDGFGHGYFISFDKMEKLSPELLKAFAENQRRLFMDSCWSKEHLINFVKEL